MSSPVGYPQGNSLKMFTDETYGAGDIPVGVPEKNLAPIYATLSDGVVEKISAGDLELLQMSAQSGTVDADVAVNNAVAWAPFTLDRPMLVNRVQGKVGTSDPQKNMEIAIYSADLKKLASTGIQEIPVAGYFEFAVPETKLPTGKYFFAMSCKSAGTATFGHTMRNGGFTSFIRHPISKIS